MIVVNLHFRYQNKDTMEAGVPKDAPKPAPSKTKKNELINPTTFTIADKIVDQVNILVHLSHELEVSFVII